MPPSKDPDPTAAIREMAAEFPEVDEGTACTQSSFKTGGKAFLFAGMQGGRYKLMFKLDASLAEARALAEKTPQDFQVGDVLEPVRDQRSTIGRCMGTSITPVCEDQRWNRNAIERHRWNGF